MSTDKTTAATVPQEARTPGALLRAAREAAQLTPQSVAAELRISEEKLQALEQDQYERMMSETFVRGYIRRYAGLVKLDGDELIACYDRYLQEMRLTTEQVTQAEGAQARGRQGRPLPSWLMPAAIASGLILIWVLAVNLFNGGDGAPAAVQQQVQNPAAVTPAPLTEEDSADSAAVDSDPVADDPPAAELPADDPPIEPVTPAPVADRLELVFSDECWIEVTDAEGRVLIADLQRAGQTLSLSGSAPFNIMLGNARAVALQFNGEAVAVTPQGGRKTLRFTLGE